VTGYLFNACFQVFLGMLKYSVGFIFFIAFVSSCKQKKKEPEKKFVSALSLIRSQVAHVDTSMYPIIWIRYKDSLHSDTTFIRREEFGAAAKDFLDIPDLSDKKIGSRFEEATLYDGTINSVVITYTPKDPATEEMKKQELLITPYTGNDKVNTIIINRMISNRDSLVQRNMLWQMDKYFQVTTIRQLPGQPETTTIIKVSWNEEEYQ
jgi:hypothetical protein